MADTGTLPAGRRSGARGRGGRLKFLTAGHCLEGGDVGSGVGVLCFCVAEATVAAWPTAQSACQLSRALTRRHK
jgi:hypothetical protein